jgi:lipoprotein NlpI
MGIYTTCLVLALTASAPQQTKAEIRESLTDGAADAAPTSPLSVSQRKDIEKSNRQVIATTTEKLKSTPHNIKLLSRRADAFFNLGEFERAVTDYDHTVELDPSTDASHWRRGIALFYAKKFKQAAGQFERYHSFDNVDRENGIWRYLSQHKAYGRQKARAGLLKYRKDDREPFPAVYKLFAGQMTPQQILSQIDSAKIETSEREKRLFYAHLYIGLNEAVEGRPESAASHLRKSTANKWPINAGFGASYMWHVGRLQLDLLLRHNRESLGNTTPAAKPGNENKARETEK